MGSAGEYAQHVQGKSGLDEWCKNGDCLATFKSLNWLIIISKHFQHPTMYLPPWYSNNSRTVHQINIILAYSCWAWSVENGRPHPISVTGDASSTTHTLVGARLKLDLSMRGISSLLYNWRFQIYDHQTQLHQPSLTGTVTFITSGWSYKYPSSASLSHSYAELNKAGRTVSTETLNCCDKGKNTRIHSSLSHRNVGRHTQNEGH